MAIGDKKTVVMGIDRAVPNGVATLDSAGNVVRDQLGNASNPNLLDVWYFKDPINQRGQTEYTAQGYTIDRWYFSKNAADNSFVSPTGSGLKVYSDTAQVVLAQRFDRSFYDTIKGKTLTFSIIVDNELYHVSFVPQEAYTETTLPGSGIRVGTQLGSSNWYIQIYWSSPQTEKTLSAAKLEFGSVQTLAHQDENGNWVLNDPAPNKALELAKCQRYQLSLAGTSVYYGRTHMSTDTGGRFFIPTPSTMRAIPVLEKLNVSNFSILGNGKIFAPTSVSVAGITSTGVMCSFECETGIGVNQPIIVNHQNGTELLNSNL